MRKNRNSFFDRPWAMLLISLGLSLFLFFYVNGSFLQQTTHQGTDSALMSTTKSVSMKVPLQVSINSQRYVVTGYPQYIWLKLSGPSALVTMTANTQNFRVYANLTNLGVGEHQVRVKLSGVSSEIKADLEPATIIVNIQPRSTITVPVTVQLSNHALINDYKIGTPKLSMTNVQVSGARSVVSQVAKVIAFVNVPRNATGDLSSQVVLQVVNKQGQILNIVTMPNSISVTIPITKEESSSSTSSSSGATSSLSSSGSGSTNEAQNQVTATTATDNSTVTSSTMSSSVSDQFDNHDRNNNSNQ